MVTVDVDQLLALIARGWNKANGALKSQLFDLLPFTIVPDLVYNFGKDWAVVEYADGVNGAKTVVFAADSYRIDDIGGIICCFIDDSRPVDYSCWRVSY